MKISFFEEFPDDKAFSKLRYVNFPTTVYVAAKGIKEFERVKKEILGYSTKQRKIDVGYWPVLENSQGYWLSPFSSPKAVRQVIDEIKKSAAKLNKKEMFNVMWDAELPLRHPKLLWRIDHFLRNKRMIKKFFKESKKSNIQIATSEYGMRNWFIQKLFTFLGVSFNPKKYGNRKIVMYYTSMHKNVRPFLLKSIEKMIIQHGKSLHVGLGTIAVGILGDEPILSAKNLERDLVEMKKAGASEVVIFRLGGMNREYKRVLEKYVELRR